MTWRDSPARERATLLAWIDPRDGALARGQHGRSALATAFSVALHAALLAASSALLMAPNGAPVESAAMNVVQVNLASNISQRAAPPVSAARRPERLHATAARSPASQMLMPPPASAATSASAPQATILLAAEATQALATSGASAAPPSQIERAEALQAPAAAMASTPAYLHAPEPEYPRDAREDEQEGLVLLRVLVSVEGRPAQIRIARTSGFRALDAAAVAGVKRWTFMPATRNRQNIESWMDVPIRFRLR
jgi:protein TonB